jgi:hypothetical protein
MKRRGKNRMAIMVKKYRCKNCGSIFEPGLKADFEHIKTRCSFCHYEATLVPIPEFETLERYRQRTGQPWPENGAVYAREMVRDTGRWTRWWVTTTKNENRFWRTQIVIATEAGMPPDDWRPE